MGIVTLNVHRIVKLVAALMNVLPVPQGMPWIMVIALVVQRIWMDAQLATSLLW